MNLAPRVNEVRTITIAEYQQMVKDAPPVIEHRPMTSSPLVQQYPTMVAYLKGVVYLCPEFYQESHV